MKRQFFALVTIDVLCVALAGDTFAGAPTADAEKAQLLSQLETRAKWLDANAKGEKGVHRMQMDMQSVRVKKLIQRIKAGEQVDPQEIDALLKKGLHLGD